MAENIPESKAETSREATTDKTIPVSEIDQSERLRRPKRKIYKSSEFPTDTFPRSSASPPPSVESRGRTRDHHPSYRGKKRHRRHSTFPPRSDGDMQSRSRSRSRSPKSKERPRGLKGGLMALGGLVAAGLPIAGELYLKHMAHEHEREKDERKEVRHEQAMEERERKRMDLELDGLEEETAWLSRKHEIDIRRREVDLQIRELERDELWSDKEPGNGKMVVERGRQRPERARREWDGAEDASPQSFGTPGRTQALLHSSSYPPDGSQDLILARHQKRRLYDEDDYRGRGSLPLNYPSENPFRPLPPVPPHRERPLSPVSDRKSRSRSRSHSPPPTRLRGFPVTTALIAGSLTAYKVRNDDGPWMGKKAARVATSAGTAALSSLILKREEIPRGPDDGLLAQVLDSRPVAVATPVIAGIGVERALWGRRR
jgi:hypothetical protein